MYESTLQSVPRFNHVPITGTLRPKIFCQFFDIEVPFSEVKNVLVTFDGIKIFVLNMEGLTRPALACSRLVAGFLKLLLCGTLACLCVCLCVHPRGNK